VKHLLCLLALAAAAFLPGRADPAVVGQVAVTGGFHASGGTGNSPGATSGPTRVNTPGGAPSLVPVNNGPRCLTPTICTTPYISISPGASGSYSNYQVISDPHGTATSNSEGTVYSSAPAPQVVYVPVPAPAPLVAVGTVDEKGLVHSPFSKSVLKIANVTNGQLVHDPVTGQVFYVQVGPTRVANQID
jgi:hypothetical protein